MATINGTNADDVLTGTNESDVITGLGGDDTINAGNGNDTVFGDFGPDGAPTAGFNAAPLQLQFANARNESTDGTSVEYVNVTELDDGTPVFARLTVLGKTSDVLQVDLTGRAGGEILLNNNRDASVRGEQATIRMEFFNQDTGLPVSLTTAATFGDLDLASNGTEQIDISREFFTAFGTSQDSDLTVVEGTDSVSAFGGQNTNARDQDAWFSTILEERQFIEFTVTSRAGPTGYTVNGNLIDDPVLTPLTPGDDVITGGNGDDVIFGQEGDDNLSGDEGNDTLDGGTGDDDLSGGGGQDVLAGGDGDDAIKGGDGDDEITGGAGDDLIDGGTGQDRIDAGDGDDRVQGGQGDDALFGRDGDDDLRGGQGQDLLAGGDGDDRLAGGSGDDTLVGGDGDDILMGDDGNDGISGGDGDDRIAGGQGNDRVSGGDGDDQISGGAGQDQLSGGADADTFTIGAGEGNGDRIDGGTAGDDRDTLDLTGSGPLRFVNLTTDEDGDSQSGRVEFLDDSGNITGRLEFTEIETIIPCFTSGTMIATPAGECRIEDLTVGQQVITRDNGMQRIRWIGQKTVSAATMRAMPQLAPVMIRAGALGHDLPERDLLLSPNHRLLMTGQRVDILFDAPEVLSAAKHLTALDGVDQVQASQVTYWHILFDNHEVILSNGAWSESFQPGDYSLKGIGDAQRQEVLNLFPQLASEDGITAYDTARLSLRKFEAALLSE